MNILWFSNIGDYTSFSRISEAMIEELIKKGNKVSLLTNNKNEKMKTADIISKLEKIVYLGQDTSIITFEDFKNSWKEQRTDDLTLEFKIKYSIIQLADILHTNTYDYLIISNGIYECEYILSLLEDKKELLGQIKIVLWTPIDFIPPKEMMTNLLKCDKFITMTEEMSNIINSYNISNTCKINWVGHGNFNYNNLNINKDPVILRQENIEILNNVKDKFWVANEKLNKNDIIILNANDCVPRKQLEVTIRTFIKFSQNRINSGVKIKLWLHTNLKKIMEIIRNLKIPQSILNNIILSNNNISDFYLQCIYNVCQIGIQTSTGEGWSLTNCEHSLTGAIQIVPNFLATGQHFKEDRGVLVPVFKKKTVNGSIIGEIDENKLLLELINVVNNINEIDKIEKRNKMLKYFSQFSWDKCSDKFISILQST